MQQLKDLDIQGTLIKTNITPELKLKENKSALRHSEAKAKENTVARMSGYSSYETTLTSLGTNSVALKQSLIIYKKV